jgi:hypothetical protein
MKLPNGLHLFIADVVDVKTGTQEIWRVVDETYDSALACFIEWANEMLDRYDYYFFEADEDVVEDFIEWHDGEDIDAGIYDK